MGTHLCLQLCGETGVVVDAKAQRDSLYRSAAELAATCCEEQTNRLGGQTAGKFLSGLASDLGQHPLLLPPSLSVMPLPHQMTLNPKTLKERLTSQHEMEMLLWC